MKCPSCGRKVVDYKYWCPYCGASLEVDDNDNDNDYEKEDDDDDD